jgi:hypothetical protein
MAKKQSVRRSAAREGQNTTWAALGDDMPPNPHQPTKAPTPPTPPPEQERPEQERPQQEQQRPQMANNSPIDFDEAISAIESAIPSLYTTMELIRALGHSLAPHPGQ